MADLEQMRVYVAGPMESVGGNMNEPLFDYVASKLRAKGCEVFNPIELTRELLGSIAALHKMEKKERKAMRRAMLKKELVWIIDNADGIYLLPGWERSAGAKAERAVAEAIGIEIREAENHVILQFEAETKSSVEPRRGLWSA